MSFQKLTTDYLRKVRPLLQSQLPMSSQILNIIDLKLQGVFLQNTYETRFYGIPDTEIINVTWSPTNRSPVNIPKINLIYAPPPSLSIAKMDTDSIAKAYHKMINWTKPQIFETVPVHIFPKLEKLIETNAGHITDKIPLVLLYLPEDGVKRLNTKQWEERARNKFEMHKLTSKNSEKISIHWKYGQERKIGYLQELIKVYGGARGIFKKGEQTNSGLVCWALLLEIGTVGGLFTLEEARGHGLARWAYEACCKIAAEEYNLTPMCEVEVENTASLKLMEKVGKKKLADVYYMKYVPSPVTP